MTIYSKKHNTEDTIADFLGLSPMPKEKLRDILNQNHYGVLLEPSEVARQLSLKRVEDGSHNFIGPENNRRRVENKTHNLLRENGGSELARKTQQKRLDDKTHVFLDGSFSRKTQEKRLNDKTHNFQKENGGSELARESNAKRINDKTHNWLISICCRDRHGNVVSVPKEVYHKQKEVTKDMTQWDFATITSSEGKRRKTLSQQVR